MESVLSHRSAEVSGYHSYSWHESGPVGAGSRQLTVLSLAQATPAGTTADASARVPALQQAPPDGSSSRRMVPAALEALLVPKDLLPSDRPGHSAGLPSVDGSGAFLGDIQPRFEGVLVVVQTGNELLDQLAPLFSGQLEGFSQDGGRVLGHHILVCGSVKGPRWHVFSSARTKPERGGGDALPVRLLLVAAGLLALVHPAAAPRSSSPHQWRASGCHTRRQRAASLPVVPRWREAAAGTKPVVP